MYWELGEYLQGRRYCRQVFIVALPVSIVMVKQKGLKFVILKIQTFFRKRIISGILRYLTLMHLGF